MNRLIFTSSLRNASRESVPAFFSHILSGLFVSTWSSFFIANRVRTACNKRDFAYRWLLKETTVNPALTGQCCGQSLGIHDYNTNSKTDLMSILRVSSKFYGNQVTREGISVECQSPACRQYRLHNKQVWTSQRVGLACTGGAALYSPHLLPPPRQQTDWKFRWSAVKIPIREVDISATFQSFVANNFWSDWLQYE